MYNIGEKIKFLRKIKNLTQDELAEKINITKQTVMAYETEKRLIPIDILDSIAKEFSIPIESFFSVNNDIFKTIKNNSKIKKIPIISRINVEKEKYDNGDILDWIEMPISLCKNCDYATFVKGDSMEPKILDNDLVLVQKTISLENGNIGIFRIQEDVLCKKYYSNPLTKEIILKSINPKYDSIYIDENFNEDFYILGKVVCKIDYNF
ncbi:XRE family transcriptional regulator [uncultured Fusobacterium sp.]|uniref:LexA family protein n=1 Tax=uncultured Fusobacterium sp. TaxID=159267 RepID=UPI0027DE1DF0|nr:XRE family transcriptional regulator [uncultured Fusobacterium sp.]